MDIIPAHKSYRWLLVLLFALGATACTPSFDRQMAELAKEIGPNESAAVSWIYEEPSGNITSLGDDWRQRVEKGLRDHQVEVKARKDIGVIIDDIGSFGLGGDEQKVWQQAGADVVISGNYHVVSQSHSGGEKPHIYLTIKALRVDDSAVVKTVLWQDTLAAGWSRRAASIHGNAHQKDIEIITDSSGNQSRPLLSAQLDRNPACYPTGSVANIMVHTDPGSYVYLLNLAADNTMTLLYPNKKMADQPLPSGILTFPPAALAGVQLQFYPLDPQQTCSEAIKVISSRVPIDFSYLPIPENTLYAGAAGGDIKQVATTLKQARGWSEKVLTYMVGPDCR